MPAPAPMPAEWAPHACCFTAYPHLVREWGADLEPARREVEALCRALTEDVGGLRGEAVELLVPDDKHEAMARARLGDGPVRYRQIAYGDIWLRDIAPLFLRDADGERALTFVFNGWGNKYRMPGDTDLAARLAEALGVEPRQAALVCEGGALEVDGEGTCMTTRDCLLHPNRNPHLSETEVAERLRRALGVEHVLWLEGALANDHTDGHVDTLARFVAPGVVACMEPEPDDPNAEVLAALLSQLRTARDARGRRLEVATLPAPGRVEDRRGDLMPASYCNFYIGNATVVVPTYGSPQDDAAVARVAELFPGRRTVGLSARAILSGGGAFHCITQQRPAGADGGNAP